MKTYCIQFKAQRFVRFFALLLAGAASVQAAIRITSVTGTVTLYTAAGEYRPAVVGDVLQPGDSMVTSYHSEAEFQSDGATVRLQENSSVSESDRSTPESISLNYGVIEGQVPHSAAGMFSVYTPLGVPEIQAGSFIVNNIFNVERQEMILQVENKDGRVGLRSRYAGTMEYGRHYAGDKNYNGAMTESMAVVPPQHTAIIRLPASDPYFFDRVDAASNFAPEAAVEMAKVGFNNVGVKISTLTPEDPSVQVPSISTRR